MPFGLVLLVAFSFIVFRKARRKGRSGLLWVVILWVSCVGLGFLAAVISQALLLANGAGPIDVTELRSALLLPTGLGMFAGAVIPIVVLNQVAPNR